MTEQTPYVKEERFLWQQSNMSHLEPFSPPQNTCFDFMGLRWTQTYRHEPSLVT